MNNSLPGEPGDSLWFDRLNPFAQQETLRQVRFKRARWPGLPDGMDSRRPDRTYPHILPAGHTEKAFYPPLAGAILDYLQAEKIAPHSELLNLRSSQAACLNFLFPLSQDLHLAARVFSAFLPGLARVEVVAFEYTGPPQATAWLGEPSSGRSGQNRTSIDAAVFWQDARGRCCALLIEWKYTETSYGACSAFQNEPCLRLVPLDNPAALCPLCRGQHPARRRRYWEHLETAGVNRPAAAALAGCPFQGPFYQLLRQNLLAAWLRTRGGFHQAQVASLHFTGNHALQSLPAQLRPLGQPGVLPAWNSLLLPGTPPMLDLSVQALGQALDHAGGEPGWRVYLRERYGV